MNPVFHLVAPQDWPSHGWYRPASLASEGFVHLSFAGQVAGSADRHFGGHPALLCVELDPQLLGAEIRVEDTYSSGTSYPHLYGPIPVAAALSVQALRRDVSGRWAAPDADEAAGASPDR